MSAVLGRSAGATDRGRRRHHNEDAFVCAPPLFAIADGMGGARAGEVASRLAAAVLNEAAGDARGEGQVADLIQEANRRVFARSSADEETSGMGTTMTLALVDGDRIAFGHVGDSRAYRLRAGEFEQLTDDHSLVGELVRSGRLSREEAEVHPQRSVITRALGTEPDVDVDTFTVEAVPGDLYLLCSDGLTDMLSDADILPLLEREEDAEAVVRRLVQAANTRGGEDNITVVVFGFRDASVAVEETVLIPPEERPDALAPDDDEDTLSGLEGVPVVTTGVVHTADIERHLEREGHAAPPAAREDRGGRSLLPLLLLVLLLAAIAALVLWGLWR